MNFKKVLNTIFSLIFIVLILIGLILFTGSFFVDQSMAVYAYDKAQLDRIVGIVIVLIGIFGILINYLYTKKNRCNAK